MPRKYYFIRHQFSVLYLQNCLKNVMNYELFVCDDHDNGKIIKKLYYCDFVRIFLKAHKKTPLLSLFIFIYCIHMDRQREVTLFYTM